MLAFWQGRAALFYKSFADRSGKKGSVMKVQFSDCNVREVRSGTSKKGSEYAVVRIFSPEPEMYELFFTGPDVDLAKQLVKGNSYDFSFDLLPAYNGGVRLAFDGPAVPAL